MTKADSKKNLFYSMFVRNIYIAVVYVLALNFFVKSVLFVPCLPRGFVLGTRFKFYVLNIFFFWGGGGLKTVSTNFWSVYSLRGSATRKESSDGQSGTNGLSTKLPFSLILNSAFFIIVEWPTTQKLSAIALINGHVWGLMQTYKMLLS